MAVQEDRRNSVFISYTHRDRSFATRLAGDLRSLGCEVWLDEWMVKIGDSLIREVTKAIADAKWMVIVLSPAAMKSGWVDGELRAGLARELNEKSFFILPVLKKKVHLPEFLSDRFYADFSKSYEQGLRLLKDRIVGNYLRPGKASWLLVRNPLPDGLLSPALRPDMVISSGLKEVNLLSVLSSLTGDNMRRQLASVRGFLGSHLDVQPPERWVSLLHESSHNVLEVIDRETWFGNSGRLVLRRTGQQVHGDYDWHGLSMVGRIEGEVIGDAITFDWSWTLTTEKGRGIFWTNVENVLHGGWWSDFDNVDESAILRKAGSPPNAWEFARVPNLTIQDDMVGHDSARTATDKDGQ